MLRLLLTLSLLMKQSERTCSVLKRSAGLLAWLAIPLNGYSPFFCPIFSKVNGYAPFFNRVLWIFLAFLTLFIPCFLGGYAPFYTGRHTLFQALPYATAMSGLQRCVATEFVTSILNLKHHRYSNLR